MTKEQVDNFNSYLKETDPSLFEKTKEALLFIKTDESDQLDLIEWKKIAHEDNDRFFELLNQFKKENRIYNPVPTIENDFLDFVLHKNHEIYSKLQEITITYINGKPEVSFVERDSFSQVEKEIFKTLWRQFLEDLKFV